MIFVCLTIVGYSQDKRDYDLSVVGNTIAYDSLSDKVLIPGGYQIQTFLFRINKLKRGEENSKYILIYYFHIAGKPLTKEISDSKISSKFNLVRKKDCDGKISDFIYKEETISEGENLNLLKPLPGQEDEFRMIPVEQRIPCYRIAQRPE